MTTILIARHGNNFDPGETAVRIGVRTDLPLSSSGKQQAKNLGHYLRQNNIDLAAVFVSDLKRTQETAEIALQAAGFNLVPIKRSMFNEIDYGPDEGKTNEQMIARIGARSLEDWDTMAVVPEGWKADVDQIVQNWRDFAAECLKSYQDQTVLVITSNGIARFAPYLTNNFFSFGQTHKLKLVTGSFGSLSYHDGNWRIDYWNEVPPAEPFVRDLEPTEYGEDDTNA